MTDIQTPLTRVPAGDVYANTLDEDAFVITEFNTHMDILRFVVDDLGWSEAFYHIESLNPCPKQ
jgi:hypothetical protein